MIDFFAQIHNPQSSTQRRLWCADKQNNTAAYVTDQNDDQAIVAEICNDQQKEITFVAIDHNIPMRSKNSFDDLSRCDGMIHFDRAIYFIELKDKRSDWIQGAKDQLISTISVFRQNHDLNSFRRKRAYACNRSHPHFYYFDEQELGQFARQSGGFKLIAEGKISIT